MKKRFFSLLFATVLGLMLTIPAFATDDFNEPLSEPLVVNSSPIIYLEDGSYITTELREEIFVVNDSVLRSESLTKKGSKTVTYRDSNGNVDWEYILSGEFAFVEGVSAICTNATYTVHIYNDDWSFSNGSATKSSNVAYGVGTFKKKLLFITTKTVNIDISITCDVNGNLS